MPSPAVSARRHRPRRGCPLRTGRGRQTAWPDRTSERCRLLSAHPGGCAARRPEPPSGFRPRPPSWTEARRPLPRPPGSPAARLRCPLRHPSTASTAASVAPHCRQHSSQSCSGRRRLARRGRSHACRCDGAGWRPLCAEPATPREGPGCPLRWCAATRQIPLPSASHQQELSLAKQLCHPPVPPRGPCRRRPPRLRYPPICRGCPGRCFCYVGRCPPPPTRRRRAAPRCSRAAAKLYRRGARGRPRGPPRARGAGSRRPSPASAPCRR
mmetsp:Transcript_8389/g.25431  ORF Transcript_8389/g.25431 Transcript_8389/m.25431 type:complete len:269 (-) Transcript_8389:389-1195(-)